MLPDRIDIPAAATDIQLKFWHEYQFQNERDGGRLEFSINGGTWFDVTDSGSGASFASNGYNATLKGTGNVYLQSLPFSRMADRILAHAPSAGGKQQGEGSVLGGIGRMLDGN